jgi:hypothetical protein
MVLRPPRRPHDVQPREEPPMAYSGLIFDADNHVVERADDLNRHVPARYRQSHLIESREATGGWARGRFARSCTRTPAG